MKLLLPVIVAFANALGATGASAQEAVTIVAEWRQGRFFVDPPIPAR